MIILSDNNSASVEFHTSSLISIIGATHVCPPLRRYDLFHCTLKRLAAFVCAKLPSGLLEPLGLLSLGHLPPWLSLRRRLWLFGHIGVALQ